MNEEFFELLEEYVEAKIDHAIELAFGRDTLNESIRVSQLRQLLIEAVEK